jgi:acyl-CoA synthetase (AMP-forming)/AMP-acid ligase II
LNILEAFGRQVAAHPDRIAVVDGRGKATSYAELDARGAALAGAWYKAGLREGDRVLLALPLDADLYAALAGLWRIGAAAVLPEPALGLYGLRHAVAATAPKALLASGLYRLLPLLGAVRRIPLRLSMRGEDRRPIADLPADTTALISFTSGSSGAPKAIPRSHAFLAAQDRAVAPLIATGGKAETDLVAFPVFVVANLGQGVSSVLPNWPLKNPAKARGEAIRAHAERHGVTRLLLSPAIAETLADHIPAGAHTLFTGGGPVFPDLIARYAALRMVAVYGSTEAEPIAEIDAAEIGEADWAEMRTGSGLLVGRPVTPVRIVEDEIQVAGEHVVQGYLDPAHDAAIKVREGGTVWHRTGDGGRFDEQGRLWLRGRIGARVAGLWPFEIEAPARFWPGVRRAALTRGPVLVIEGDARFLPEWQAASAIPVKHLPRIPVDRRHGSKIDQAALDKLL